jgi:hypothetical protein
MQPKVRIAPSPVAPPPSEDSDFSLGNVGSEDPTPPKGIPAVTAAPSQEREAQVQQPDEQVETPQAETPKKKFKPKPPPEGWSQWFSRVILRRNPDTKKPEPKKKPSKK